MKKQRKLLKWIALSLCLMPWVQVRATDYLRGSWDEHSVSIEFVYKEGYGVAKKTLAANTTYQFGFDNAGTWKKNTGTMTKDNSIGWSFETGEGNCGLKTDVAGEYIFEVRWDNNIPYISVHYPGNTILKGDWDSWADHEFTYNYGVFSCTLSLPANTTKEFGFQIGDNFYKNNGTMASDNCIKWKFQTGGDGYSQNAKLTTTIAGDYTFKLKFEIESTVSYPYLYVVFPTGQEYVIHCKKDDGWSSVYAYRYFDTTSCFDEPWSGVQLTANTLNPDYYDFTFRDTFNKIIFSDNGSNQTGNLSVDFDHTETWAENRSEGWYSIHSTAPSPWYIRDLGVSFEYNVHDWATYVSDVDLALPTNVTAYTVSGVSAGVVTVTSVGYIPANVPVLLQYSTGGNYGTIASTKAEAYTGSTSSFTSILAGSATTTSTTTANADYILYNNKFVLCEGTSVAQNRCYLPAAQVGSSARELSIVIDNGETGIETVKREAITNSCYYDLQGRSVAHPTRGLYIVNGKKYIVK